MVILDGLVRNRRPGHRFVHEPPAYTVTGWKETIKPTEDFQAGDERPTGLDQARLQGQAGQIGAPSAAGLIPDPVQVRTDGAYTGRE
jgi:hypothetical protein